MPRGLTILMYGLLILNVSLLQVKFELPATLSGPGIEMESDVRFAGAFVLYNYARLATLFTHFRRACANGKPSRTSCTFSQP